MKYIFFSSILIVLLVSCVTQHKIELLENKNNDTKDYMNAQYSDNTVKPNNELFIKILSLNEIPSTVYSNTSEQLGINITPNGASLMSHTIDNNRNLTISVIGKINGKKKRISHVSEIIKTSLLNILKQPVVTVKLINHYITVINEINNPKHFSYSQDKLTIYDAIDLAGDITEYAIRSQIILLRNENGITHRINIDLNKTIILTSDFYFLRPNAIL